MSAVANPGTRLADSTGGHGARAYILHHDQRVKMLDRQSFPVLRDVWRGVLALNGDPFLLGGPDDDRDSLVKYITDMEFPDIERAREIYNEWALVQQPAIGQE